MHARSDTFEEHLEHLELLFKRALRHNITFNFGKSIFSMNILVHYDTCALSSPLLHGVKLGPERSEGPITPCNGLLKTLVS